MSGSHLRRYRRSMIEDGDLLLVGVLLLAVVPVVVVQSVFGYSRGRFDRAFWALPLDDKLDRVADHRSPWWLIAIGEFAILGVVTAGLAGLADLVARIGAGSLPWVALGGYLVAAMAWLVGMVLQVAVVWRAAEHRRDSGATPSWIHPLWLSGYVAEGVWVILANLAYVGFGAGLLASGLGPAWAGWTAIGLGVAIPLVVVVTRDGFPQLLLPVPLLVGVALLVEAF